MRDGGVSLSTNLSMKPLPPSLHARLIMARGMRLLDDLFSHPDTTLENPRRLVEVRRVAQGIVDTSEHAEASLFSVIPKKPDGPYLPRHSVNVAVISVILGRRVGLGRRHLAELALAGLYHEIGRTRLPRETQEKAGFFGARDRDAMSRHPLHGAALIVALAPQNPGIRRRALCCFELNIQSNGYPVRKWTRLHPFSRILAIACAYDAMTTPRPWRPAHEVEEALLHLHEEAGRCYDPNLVALFAEMVGT